MKKKPGWATAAAPALLAAAFSFRKISSLDTWWHLASGKWIWENGRIPTKDIFSHTVVGQPWIDVWWGFQALAYPIHKQFGFGGLILLKSALVFAAFVVTVRTVRPAHRGPLLGWLLALGILASQLRFHVRPTAFTFLFFATYIWILEQHQRTGGRRIWLLPLLHLVWANMHGVAVVGVAVILMYSFADFWKKYFDRPRSWDVTVEGQEPAPWLLLAVAGLCLLVSVINPYGLRGLAYAWGQIFWVASDSNELARLLEEHLSPFSSRMMQHRLTYASSVIFTALVAVSFLLNLRHLRRVALLMFAAFLFLYLSAMRNSVLFALATVPFTTENYLNWWVSERERGKAAVPVWFRKSAVLSPLVFALWGMGAALHGAYYRWDRGDFEPGLGVQSGLYPTATTQYLAHTPIRGNLYNDLNPGGYLIWNLYPGKKVFIDPRNFVFGEFGRRYAQARGRPGEMITLMRQYGVTHALVSHTDHVNDSLLRELARRPNWRLLQCDGQAALFLKNSRGNLSLFEGTSEAIPPQAKATPASFPELRPHVRGLLRMARCFRVLQRDSEAEECFRLAGKAIVRFGDRALHDEKVYAAVLFEAAVSCLVTVADYDLAAEFLGRAVPRRPGSLEELNKRLPRAPVWEDLAEAFKKIGKPSLSTQALEMAARAHGRERDRTSSDSPQPSH